MSDIDLLLDYWGYRRRIDNDPGLGVKPQPWVNLIKSSDIFKEASVQAYDETELEDLDRIINAMPQYNYYQWQALVTYYINGWHEDKRVDKTLMARECECSVKTFYKRLNQAKGYVGRYV